MESERRVRKTDPKENTQTRNVYTHFTPECIDQQSAKSGGDGDCTSVRSTLEAEHEISKASSLVTSPPDLTNSVSEGVNSLPQSYSAFSDLSSSNYELIESTSTLFEEQVEQNYHHVNSSRFSEESFPSETELLTESCFREDSQSFDQIQEGQGSEEQEVYQCYIPSDLPTPLGILTYISHPNPLVILHNSESESSASFHLEAVASGLVRRCHIIYTPPESEQDCLRYLIPPKQKGKLYLRYPIVKFNADFQATSFILPYFDRFSNTGVCLSAFKATIRKDLDKNGFYCCVSAIDGLNKSVQPPDNVLEEKEEADVRIGKECFISMDRSKFQVFKIDEGFESQVQDDNTTQDSTTQVYYSIPDDTNKRFANGQYLENFHNSLVNGVNRSEGGTVQNVAFNLILDPLGNLVPEVVSISSTSCAVNEVTNPSLTTDPILNPIVSSTDSNECSENIRTYCNSSCTGVNGNAESGFSQPLFQITAAPSVTEEIAIPSFNQDSNINGIRVKNFGGTAIIENTPELLGSNHLDTKKVFVPSFVNNNVSPKTNVRQIVGNTVYVPCTHPNSLPNQQVAPSVRIPILRQQLESKQGQAQVNLPSVPYPVSVLREGSPIVNGTSIRLPCMPNTEVLLLPASAASNNVSSPVVSGESSLSVAPVTSSPNVQIQQNLPSAAPEVKVSISVVSQSPRVRYQHGLVAVCRSCGMTSQDLLNCERCKRAFPEDYKVLEDKYALGEKNLPVAAATKVGLGPNNSPIPANPLANINKRTPGGGKKSRLSDSTSAVIKKVRGRKTEEIVLLSSDEDDEADQPKAKILKQDIDNCAKPSSSCSPKRLTSVGSDPLPPGITKHVQVNLVKLPNSPSSTTSGSKVQVQQTPTKRPQIMLTPGASLDFDSGERERSFAVDTPEDVIHHLKNYDEKSTKVGDFTLIDCCHFRIGDYTWNARPNGVLKVARIGIYFAMPHAVNENQMVDIGIPYDAVLSTIVHFTPRLPCIFLQTGPKYAEWIRKALGLNKESVEGNYYSPVDGATCQKSIAFQTIAPCSDMTYGMFKKIFKSTLNEFEYAQANDLVVRFKCDGHDISSETLTPKSKPSSSRCPIAEAPPTASQNGVKCGVVGSTTQPANCNYSVSKKEQMEHEEPKPLDHPGVDISENKKILSYQGITINQLDIMCLSHEQFLNDSILDSWMRYLEHEVLSPVDRSRTYMFSTFFYKRLTTTPKKRSQGPSEDDKLTKAEKRHARVSRWTKKVDIFSKDFVFVPINENCHWFLAVICFPGLIGAHDAETGERIPEYEALKTDKLRFKYLTEHAKDASKANSDSQSSSNDSSAESQASSDLSSPSKISKMNGKALPDVLRIRQPCIIIFDSLAGESRSRIFSTLREYLTIEYKTRKGQDREFNKYTIPAIMPRVPQQPNHCDCGIFVLFYVQCFFSHPIQSFCTSLKDRMVDDWCDLRWEGMREEIYNVLKDFALRDNPNSVKFIPKLNFPRPKRVKDKGNKEIIAGEKLTLESVKPEDEPMDVDVEGFDSPVKANNFTKPTKVPKPLISSSSSQSSDDALHDVNRTSDHDHDYVSTPEKRMRQM